MFSDDITFCIADCDFTNCIRNKKNISHPEGLHSFAYFVGTDECPKEAKNEVHD